MPNSRGVASCVQVHSSATVIMTDLSQYFTWQKWELKLKGGLKTNKRCVITSVPCRLKLNHTGLLRSHKDKVL